MKEFKIIVIGKGDAFYNDREMLIGKTFSVSGFCDHLGNGWYRAGGYIFSNPYRSSSGYYVFQKVRLKKIK